MQIARLKQEGGRFYTERISALREMLDGFKSTQKEFENFEAQPEKWQITLEVARLAVTSDIAAKQRLACEFIDTDIKADLKDPTRIEAFITSRFCNASIPGGLAEAKKEAEAYALPALIQSVESKLFAELKKMSADLDQKISHYLAEFDQQKAGAGKRPPPKAIKIPFDARGAFATTLATAGATGAMAAWGTSLSSVAATGKVVGLLASLGFSGAAASSAAALMAAMGGPLGIAGVLTLGVVTYITTRESWQERLAKKIAAINSPDYIAGYRQEVTKYWDRTLAAFEESAREITQHFLDRRLEYAELVKSKEEVARNKILAVIAKLESQKAFFEAIPWVD